MKKATLDALLTARRAKRPVLLLTELDGGAQRLLTREAIDEELAGELRDAAREALMQDRASVFEGESRTFLQPHNPPLRMVIVGAVHIAQALARLAPVLGFEVVLVDPRGAWIEKGRFPELDDAQRRDDWPDEALEALALDHRTAVVTLTHDPKLDDPALQVALRSDAFYIGSLGSNKTHASRLRRLRNAGLEDTALARIAGPVGLPIGAKMPEEIALSILAEAVQARRKGFTPREVG